MRIHQSSPHDHQSSPHEVGVGGLLVKFIFPSFGGSVFIVFLIPFHIKLLPVVNEAFCINLLCRWSFLTVRVKHPRNEVNQALCVALFWGGVCVALFWGPQGNRPLGKTRPIVHLLGQLVIGLGLKEMLSPIAVECDDAAERPDIGTKRVGVAFFALLKLHPHLRNLKIKIPITHHKPLEPCMWLFPYWWLYRILPGCFD